MSKPILLSPTDKLSAERAVEDLRQETIIAVDAEGVQLGKDGPLTLLQIGTVGGRVYLFDVMLNGKQDKRFFADTGLDLLLTSAAVVKILHSCSGDSAALYHQFGIQLENVFDTQVAHLVIEEHKGRKIPSRRKLQEICQLYSENARVFEGKEDVKLEWIKIAGDFWAIRPMTADMIAYASGDVTALIPDVYETQKRYLEDNDLLGKFTERVQEEINLDIHPQWRKQRLDRNKDLRKLVIDKMQSKYRDTIKFADLQDEDEKRAIQDTEMRQLEEHSDVLKELKKDSMNAYLYVLEGKLSDPKTFLPEPGLMFKLREMAREGDACLQKRAMEAKEKVMRILISDIEKKYVPATPVENISSSEIQVLRELRIPYESEQYSPTIVSLFWKVEEHDLNEAIKDLKSSQKEGVQVSISKVNFFVRDKRVPERLKGIAQELQHLLLEDILQKYVGDDFVSLENMSTSEIQLIRELQIPYESEKYSPSIVRLFWKLQEHDLNKAIKDLKLNPKEGVQVSVSKVNFFDRDKRVPENVKEKAQELQSLLLEELLQKYPEDDPVQVANMSTSDIQLIKKLQIPYESDKYSPTVVRFFWKVEEHALNKAINDLKSNSKEGVPVSLSKVNFFDRDKRVPDNVKGKAQELQSLILEELVQKYPEDDPVRVENMSDFEIQLIRELQIPYESDKYSPTVVSLFWKVEEHTLNMAINDLKSNPKEGAHIFSSKVNFFDRDKRVPESVKGKAQELQSLLLEELVQKYPEDQPVHVEIMSDSEIQLIRELQIPYESDKYAPSVVSLFWKVEEHALNKAINDLKSNPKQGVQVSISKVNFFNRDKRVPESVKRNAQEIQSLLLEELLQKYSVDDPVSVEKMSDSEIQLIRELQIPYESDKYSPTVVNLFWKMEEHTLYKAVDDIKSNPKEGVQVSVSKINFFDRDKRVPESVKVRAQELQSLLLEELVHKYSNVDPVQVENMSEFEIQLIRGLQIPYESDKYAPSVVSLFWKVEEHALNKAINDLKSIPKQGVQVSISKVNFFDRDKRVPENVKGKAQEIQSLLLEELLQKYSLDDPVRVENMSASEIQLIRELQIPCKSEKYSPTVVSLFWRVEEHDLNKAIKNLKSNAKESVQVSVSKVNYYDRDKRVPESVKGKAQELRSLLLGDILQKYSKDDIAPAENMSASEIQLIRELQIPSESEKYSQAVVSLYWKVEEHDLNKTINDLKSNPKTYEHIKMSKVNSFGRDKRVPKSVEKKAKELQSLFLEKISQKYSVDSPVEELSEEERVFLGSLILSSESHSPVVQAMYWKVAYEKVCSKMKSLGADGTVDEGLYKKLKFYSKHSLVPQYLKQKADEFLRNVPHKTRAKNQRR